MNKKITLTRWLLVKNKSGSVDIINQEVSSYAPLNRILEDVGFYELEFFEVNQDKYFCTYDPKERNTSKSKIHVGKRGKGQLFDMTSKDYKNIGKIIEKYFSQDMYSLN